MSRLIYFFSLLLLFPCVGIGADAPAEPLPEYNLSVSFDIPASRLIGFATLKAEAGTTMQFDAPDVMITQVSLNGMVIEHIIRDGKLTIKTPSQGMLTINYEATFKGNPAGSDNAPVVTSVIDTRGIYLTRNWYPKIEGRVHYRLQASLPKGYEAVSEADRIEKMPKHASTDFVFHFDHPLEGISFIATNRFEVFEDRVNGIDFYAYFFPEDRGLAETFLQQAKKSFELYEKLLIKYPYKRFSIVENFLPSGYSTPTFTLLDPDAIRIPVAPETFLGQEVLRQWFGNSVYINTEKGNWAEGLTTYLADHLYEEQAGRGWEYRKQLLLDYDAYVNSKNEISLREFRNGTDSASKAVGYGKSALFFHMLKSALGDEVFLDGLRSFIKAEQYQRASWDDIRTAFEKQSGRDLAGFFRQWVDEKGIPELSAYKPSVRRKRDFFEIGFDIRQTGKIYMLEFPAMISMMTGSTKKEILKLDTERKSFNPVIETEPRTIVIDADYDIARKLTDPELPPVIATFLAEEKHIIVSPVSNRETYTTMITDLKARGGEEQEVSVLKDETIKSSSVVVLGHDNPLINRLFGRVESIPAGLSIIAKKNPWNARKVVLLINASSASEANAAFAKMSDYGKYSRLAFDKGRNVSKTIEDSQRGVEMELREPATAIDLSALKTLTDVTESAAEKKMVYVGEYHDRYAHHMVQLEVIESLFRKDPKLAIGMEMFQRPFQKVIDDYIAGTIDERAFLKGTEYFKRWGFDYSLYKPIIDFARARKIPVIALNQKKEIIEKVSREGLDSLTDEERKDVPRQMNFSDDAYRDRLLSVFNQHKGAGEKKFDFFYQAQVLWDETMAWSIDQFMAKNPDHRMVVIAGGGHLAYGSGIPKRAFRRNGLPYFIILNDTEADKDIANYLILPQPLEGTASPRLMAMMQVENRRVSVVGLPEGSVSKKAGIQVNDTILTLDSEKVESVEDIKLLLFYKQKGETLKVRVLRKRFLLGDKEMEFEVKL